MSISINSTRYSKFISEVNELLPTGKRVFITIFSDEAGTNKMNDTHGSPVDSKQFASLTYQYPSDTETGFIQLTFDDGSVFKLDDGNDNCWYFINDTVSGIEKFV